MGRLVAVTQVGTASDGGRAEDPHSRGPGRRTAARTAAVVGCNGDTLLRVRGILGVGIWPAWFRIGGPPAGT